MTTPVCIDISHHQGFPDFKKVAAAGVLGIIHKATEGSSYVDKNRATNCAAAKAVGLAVSTYHWLSPGSSPSAQMDFYLRAIKPVRGERVIIDYEQAGCAIHELHEAVLALINTKLDLRIAVYSGHLLKQQLGNTVDTLLKTSTDLWLAQYTTGSPSWPIGTYTGWALWQYSDTGTLPGITGAMVDFNRFNGTNEEFMNWISPTSSADTDNRPLAPKPVLDPAPDPAQQIVTIEINAPPGVRVVTKIQQRTTSD
jgi:lysozyme